MTEHMSHGDLKLYFAHDWDRCVLECKCGDMKMSTPVTYEQYVGYVYLHAQNVPWPDPNPAT